jgi:MscS family membrane protein
VLVGDTLKVGGIEGTVEDLGLRSTQIRTSDRTVVSLPNGQVANMTLENLSTRDKFWFHAVLALRYGTTTTQLNTVLEGIRRLLQASPHVEPDSVRVSFLRLGVSALEVEVVAYVVTRKATEFLEIQETLLLRVMECVESAGVQVSTPSQTIVIDTAAASEAAGRVKVTARAPDKKNGD